MFYCLSYEDVGSQHGVRCAKVKLFSDTMPDVLPNNGKNVIGILDNVKFCQDSILYIKDSPIIYIYKRNGFVPKYNAEAVNETKKNKRDVRIEISDDGTVYINPRGG